MNTANTTPNTSAVNNLLEEGIAAVKAGDKATARTKLKQVTEQDQNSEKGWYWLSMVVESESERRICLGNVMLINPQNERAKQMLEDLSNPLVAARTTTQGLSVLLGGIEPRTLKILAGVGGGLALLLIVLILGGRGSGAAVIPTDLPTPTAIYTVTTTVLPTTPTKQTAVAAVVTGVANASGPVVVLQNGTPVKTPTDPPTWTPIPSLTSVGAVLRTPVAPLPPALMGHLVTMYGESLSLDTNLPIYLLDPNSKQFTSVTDPDRGDYAVLTPNGEQVVYSRYISAVNEQQFRIINLNGAPFQELSSLWSNKPPLANHKMVSIAANGKGLVFAANNVIENDPDPTIYYLAVTFPTASSLSTATIVPTQPTDVPPTNAPQPTDVPPTDIPSTTPSLTPTVKGTKAPKVTNVKSPTPAATKVPATSRPTVQATAAATTAATGAATTAAEGPLQIVRITPKGSGLNTWPALSPDGSQIIFVNDKKLTTQGPDIYIVPMTGGTPQNLTKDSTANIEAAPQWSPDGTRIVFQSAPQGKDTNDIYVMDASGQNKIALTQGQGNNTRPQWSPDGKFIAFTSTRTGHPEIFVVDATSKTLYQLTSSATPITVTGWGK